MGDADTGEHRRLLVAGLIFATALLLSGALVWCLTGGGKTVVLVDGVSLRCEVAATAAARERGLTGHVGLAQGEGMIIVNDSPRPTTIRTGGITFPVDVSFVDDSRRVVRIVRLTPDVPRSFAVSAPSLYVIETPGGWLEANGIHVGSDVAFLGGSL